MLWAFLSAGGLKITPFKMSTILMKVRLLVSFAPGYWVLLHTAVFLVLFVLFITVWIWKNIPVKGFLEIKREKEQDIYAALEKVP